MSKHLHLVFNRPPSGVTDDEFNAWANDHFQEILAVPGWDAAWRFRLDADVQPEQPIPFPYMSLYELSGDPVVAVEELHKAHYDYPDWFPRAQRESCFAAWTCVPMSGRIVADGA
jgi:hypothetical protein